MKTLMVGYDLNKPGQQYPRLIAKLKSFPKWWHYLDSTWLIKTDLGVTQVRDALWSLMDSSDELLVIDVTGDAMAWQGLPPRAGAWIKAA
ncbi:MAG TPA: CRISPR-associated protein Cas2 [Gaiellaceae bacterium]